ncbi:hypothetical protein CYMTET_16882, partial [Cymbomonas tetramitiformis]
MRSTLLLSFLLQALFWTSLSIVCSARTLASSGELSICLSVDTSCVSLDLSNGGYTGTIPTLLAELQTLSFVKLSSNRLTGTLPSELSSILSLSSMDVSHNAALCGAIPPSLTSAVVSSGTGLGYPCPTGTIEQRPDHGGSQHVAAEHELAVHRIAHDAGTNRCTEHVASEHTTTDDCHTQHTTAHDAGTIEQRPNH